MVEQSDETHLVTIANINKYLKQYDLDANRETISDCIKELQEVGYDTLCVRSTQNQYYMRERTFSLAEVKLLVDVVQSSRFISEKQSLELIITNNLSAEAHRHRIGGWMDLNGYAGQTVKVEIAVVLKDVPAEEQYLAIITAENVHVTS